MPKLIMTKGLPASGKSTWAKEQVRASKGRTKRVNKDDLRDMLDAGGWSKNNEKHILKVRDEIIEHYLNDGFNVIVDDTNLHPKHEDTLRDLAEVYKATFEIKDFTDVPLETCIKRDLERPNSVGRTVIVNMYNQFLKEPTEPYRPPEGLKRAILCDIDGTLAHMVNRSPYDWSKVGEDTVDEVVRDVLLKYANSTDIVKPSIILLSGRDGSCRQETIKWLKDNNIPYDDLLMRSAGDMRKDFIVKQEIFDVYIRDKYAIMFVLDDRNQVVNMWRNMGLKVLQVEPGDF